MRDADRSTNRWMSQLAAACALLTLSACQQGGEGESAAEVEAAAEEIVEEPVVPEEPASGGAEKVEEKTDAYSFTYSWPERVGEIAPLRTMLAEERDASLATLKADAEAWRKDAAERGFDDVPAYAYLKEWAVVTNLPRFLSLSAGIYEYTGGAHGMSTSDALVWDREAGKPVKPIDMFLSHGSLSRAAQDRFCDALDRERARKRGAPVVRADDGGFNACIDPVENSTVILGSAGHQAFDRIGFLVPPYNAGPYAEGEYEVTLPVDAALIDAVKPEYQRFFTPGS